jgi:hypothetical protein
MATMSCPFCLHAVEVLDSLDPQPVHCLACGWKFTMDPRASTKIEKKIIPTGSDIVPD